MSVFIVNFEDVKVRCKKLFHIRFLLKYRFDKLTVNVLFFFDENGFTRTLRLRFLEK